MLSLVDETLTGSHTPVLTLWKFDDRLWNAISLSLDDCKLVLDELKQLANSLHESQPGKSINILKKSSIQFKLMLKSDDVAALRAKISTSFSAVQTTLATINV